VAVETLVEMQQTLRAVTVPTPYFQVLPQLVAVVAVRLPRLVATAVQVVVLAVQTTRQVEQAHQVKATTVA